MKKGICVLLFLGSFLVSAQRKIEFTNLEKSQLPKGINYSGEIKQAVRWRDDLGDHIVITTETGDMESKSGPSENYRDAALYAYHFLVFPDSIRQIWKVHDFIKECPLDIEANFVKNNRNRMIMQEKELFQNSEEIAKNKKR